MLSTNARNKQKERDFQKQVINSIESRISGALVFKMDPNYIQGIPDLLILYNDRWAMLEVKRSSRAIHQPNQDYWVDRMNGMSYSAFIYPQNKEEILNELERSLKIER